MIEERGDGESVGSEALSLLSYTLRYFYFSLTDLDRYGESADYVIHTQNRQSHGLSQTMSVWVVITDTPVYMRERGGAVMPHRTARAPHVRLCGPVIARPHVR